MSPEWFSGRLRSFRVKTLGGPVYRRPDSGLENPAKQAGLKRGRTIILRAGLNRVQPFAHLASETDNNHWRAGMARPKFLERIQAAKAEVGIVQIRIGDLYGKFVQGARQRRCRLRVETREGDFRWPVQVRLLESGPQASTGWGRFSERGDEGCGAFRCRTTLFCHELAKNPHEFCLSKRSIHSFPAWPNLAMPLIN